MAMIRLIKGETFFGDIAAYDWKGKFLVVELDQIHVDGKKDKRIISWSNVESVFDAELEVKEENNKKGGN
jgi:hypothetical protein